MSEIQNCPCPRCSQGFCHFCQSPVNTVEMVGKTGDRYHYLTGCGVRWITVKRHHEKTQELKASACAKHLEAK